MERKPIKRSQQILQLSKDHHFTLLFSWKIRQGLKMGIAEARMKRYVEHFWTHHMKIHFREEEDILFAPVKDWKVQKALDDHRRIEELVNKVLHSTAAEEKEHLLLLSDLVDAHVRYEERDLFPHLEKVLGEEELENIGRKLKEEPVLKDDFEDEFWVKQ